MKSKTLKILLGGVLLFSFIVIVTFLCYRLFEKSHKNFDNGILEIVIKNADNNNKSLEPITDDIGQNQNAYSFTVTNNNNSAKTYKVVLKEDSKNTLSKSQLRYELKLNGKIIALDYLNTIKGNVLDLRTIESKKTNNYELRIWVAESKSYTAWQEKSFAYSVEVATLTKEELK